MVHTPYIPNMTQTEMTKFVCPVCKKSYPIHCVKQITKDNESICTACADEIITVYQCGPKGFNKFTTDELSDVAQFVDNSDFDEVLEISKKQIVRIKYINADEFKGF